MDNIIKLLEEDVGEEEDSEEEVSEIKVKVNDKKNY